MKKTFSLIMLAMMMATGAMAQKVVLNYTNGETLKVKVSSLESITFEEEVPIGDLEYVDLGLPSGTLWATCNVGASKPEESGDYFAWGETETKDSYTWYSYRYCDGNDSSMKKYCLDAEYGTVDGKSELESGDDAATVALGSRWMMPTEEQMKELTNNCSREWTQLNGVNGVLLTGPNGNSIFLPAVGFYNGTELSYGGERGCYWSNTLDSDFSCDGTALFTTSSDCRTNNVRRFRGLPIRPVRKKLHPSDYVDLGLPSGTLWATCNVGANSPEEFGDYFAWGETEPKSDYSWETYKWCMGSNNTLTKYCPYSDWGYNGFRDGKWNFEPEDDAATANWGEDWETPDYYDFWELFDNITSEFTKVNGVKGLKLTGNNGNSIFLPVAPIRVGTGFSHVNGGYWMNIVGGYAYSRVPYESAILYFDLEIDNYAWDSNSEERCYGLFVRPVRKK